ncbi:MAG: hypothetical protein JNJ73_17925 [Hyphomonadaceae bacterium]|nr:hypothetical protein [Hyphomonadaceae bacterium]
MLTDFLLASAAALAASALACRGMIAAGVLDGPTAERKRENAPTPASGGVAIGIGFALGLVLLLFPPVRAWSAGLAPSQALSALAAIALAFFFLAVGAIDDVRPIESKVKFALFALASLAGPILGLRAELMPLGVGLDLHLPYLAAVLGSALFVFTLTNAVNFMDGANGLAMGSVAIANFFLGWLALMSGQPATAALAFCGAAALAGFLFWNLPAGRLFAGDSGALFAGAVAAFTSLLYLAESGASPLLPAMLFFPLLADVLLTLAYRLGKGEPLLEGHRDHLYQVAIRAGMSHVGASLRYWLLTALCGMIALAAAAVARGDLAFLVRLGPFDQTLRAIASYAPTAAFVALIAASLILEKRVRALEKALP